MFDNTNVFIIAQKKATELDAPCLGKVAAVKMQHAAD